MKVIKWISYIILTSFVILLLLSVIGFLSFGYGVGDIVFVLILFLSTVSYLFCVRYTIKKNQIVQLRNLSILFLIILLSIIFKATVGRGIEYPWNGKIFYRPNV